MILYFNFISIVSAMAWSYACIQNGTVHVNLLYCQFVDMRMQAYELK